MPPRAGDRFRWRLRTGSTTPGAVAVCSSPVGADRAAVCVPGRVRRSVAGERSRTVPGYELAPGRGRKPTSISEYRSAGSGGQPDAVASTLLGCQPGASLTVKHFYRVLSFF